MCEAQGLAGQGELSGSVVANRCPGARPGFPGPSPKRRAGARRAPAGTRLSSKRPCAQLDTPPPSPRAARASAALPRPPLRPRARFPAAHVPARRPARAPDSWRRESQRPPAVPPARRPTRFRRFRENAALWQPVLRGGLSWMADERNMRGRWMGNAALIWGNTCC